MGKRAQELYGVIGGVQSAQDFEAMFESPESFEPEPGDASMESVQ